MKIYTKTGDGGQTSLYGGERVEKFSLHVEAYGAVDEANSAIGLARANLDNQEVDQLLAHLQNAMFDLGADLATRLDSPYGQKLNRIEEKDVEQLETLIDRFESELEPLNHFIHPGGTTAAAALQLARAITRRAEREVWRLAGEHNVNLAVARYLNRLSDLLFVLARVVNQRAGIEEAAWQVGKR